MFRFSLSRWVGPAVSRLFGRPYDRCGDTGGNQGLEINRDFGVTARRVFFAQRFFFSFSFSHRLLLTLRSPRLSCQPLFGRVSSLEGLPIPVIGPFGFSP